MSVFKPAVFAGLLVGALAAPAFATFNVPAKASLLKINLAVAYNVCTSPNATQFQGPAGLPACTPPVATTTNNPTNVTTFGPKGTAQAVISVVPGDIKIGIKASGVLNNGVPANGINLKAATTSVIATSNNCHTGTPPQSPPPNADCTSQNIGPLFSAIFNVPCTNGTCALKSTVNTIIPGAITSGTSANTQISGIGLADPDGDMAFQEGLFIP